MIALIIIALFVLALDVTGFGVDDSSFKLLYVNEEGDESSVDTKESTDTHESSTVVHDGLDEEEKAKQEAENLLKEIYKGGN